MYVRQGRLTMLKRTARRLHTTLHYREWIDKRSSKCAPRCRALVGKANIIILWQRIQIENSWHCDRAKEDKFKLNTLLLVLYFITSYVSILQTVRIVWKRAASATLKMYDDKANALWSGYYFVLYFAACCDTVSFLTSRSRKC